MRNVETLYGRIEKQKIKGHQVHMQSLGFTIIMIILRD